MKKIYMTPELMVVSIRNTQLLSGSPLDTTVDIPEQKDFSGTTDDTSGNLGRRGLWDDDDEGDW